MCVPCCIYSDGEIHTSVLLFSGKFSFAFLTPPLPFFQPLSTFPQIMARFQPHRTPEGGQHSRSVCWCHPRGCPGEAAAAPQVLTRRAAPARAVTTGRWARAQSPCVAQSQGERLPSLSRSGERMWGGCVCLNSSQFNSVSSCCFF